MYLKVALDSESEEVIVKLPAETAMPHRPAGTVMC